MAVLGLGNVLMGDDAVGPTVLSLLESELELPAGVDLLDLGTPGPELAHIVEGRAALVVIDTIRAPGAPGELRLLRREDILRGRLPDRLSPHDPSLRGALIAADLLGHGPEDVLLVGIVPGRVQLGLGLTPEVRAALPRAVEAVAAELDRLGCPVRRRPDPLPAERWWEEGGANESVRSEV